VTQSGGSTQVAEGGAIDTNTVVLTAQPADGTGVVVNGHPNAANSTRPRPGVPIPLVFDDTNWNTPLTSSSEPSTTPSWKAPTPER